MHENCGLPYDHEVVWDFPIKLWEQNVGAIRLHADPLSCSYKVSYEMFNPGFSCQSSGGGAGCGFAVLKDQANGQMLPWAFCSPAAGQRSCQSAWIVASQFQDVFAEVNIHTPYGMATGRTPTWMFAADLD